MNRNTYPYLFKGVMMAIVTFLIEYLVFAFVSNSILLILLVIAALTITNHILLETTLRYRACLMHTIILLVLWGFLSYLLMGSGEIGKLHYSWLVWLTVALNWLVPYIYCFFRQYLDRGPRFPDYNRFFIGITIVFFIPFTVCFIYLNYINPNFFTIYHPKEYSYIPFYTTASYVENIFKKNIEVSSFSIYIALYTLLFLPLGYHVRLLSRDFSMSIRFVFFMLLCTVAEVVKIPILDAFNVDNILYSFLGMLIGGGLFAYVDFKHYQKKDTEYLYKSSFNFTYRY